ncbi:WD40/YVTN repeat-like-containing domain protein [Niveomyces insectorum RCEF 264]|uniref:WD40/YVTN repeat-like-containing domain protein n=1 Tax=Niveomyces insectorum RCEF 264 TaxID=1081102 RepID=A0A167WFS2_9HYPO|nr:WD40/YVTN repeat-like-containing domain protein [Niveomyces insectorum RCEF 264]
MYELAEVDEFRFSGYEPPYVLDLIPLASGLAAISSDGKLTLFDPAHIGRGPKCAYMTSHGNVTAAKALDAAGSVVATAGENGTVALWDLREPTQEAQATVQIGSCDMNVTSLACDTRTQSIAAGTELADHQASIIIWDLRAGTTPKVSYNDVHSDDVTELNYHPTRSHILLSGSTDGLVNICDTQITDEDEVVVQAFNHGSIHHAGFLNDTEVYALSHDEKLALYDMAEEREAGSAIKDFGDIRQALNCQYVASVVPKAGEVGAVLGAGSQDAKMFCLFHLTKNQEWAFALESVVGLPGAHGSEIVRSFCVFDEQQTVYTCGEDGKIRAWRPPA